MLSVADVGLSFRLYSPRAAALSDNIFRQVHSPKTVSFNCYSFYTDPSMDRNVKYICIELLPAFFSIKELFCFWWTINSRHVFYFLWKFVNILNTYLRIARYFVGYLWNIKKYVILVNTSGAVGTWLQIYSLLFNIFI